MLTCHVNSKSQMLIETVSDDDVTLFSAVSRLLPNIERLVTIG